MLWVVVVPRSAPLLASVASRCDAAALNWCSSIAAIFGRRTRPAARAESDCAKMICGGSLSSRGSTRPARRADLSVPGIASVAMRSSVFTPLDNVEEFCPKKLPCAYDTDGPLEHSATAAFDPERPDLARNADAAPLREAFREHISPASIRTDTERKHPQPWASASPCKRSSST